MIGSAGPKVRYKFRNKYAPLQHHDQFIIKSIHNPFIESCLLLSYHAGKKKK